MTDIKALQRAVYQNKLDKGFNVTDVCAEFCRVHAEMSEAFQAYSRKKDDLGEELADVVIYMLGLAEILGIDLEAEIARKVEINANRKYVREGDGHRVIT